MSPVSSPMAPAMAASDQPRGIFQQTATAVRQLNNAPDANKDFTVTRDPETQQFVVLVRDRATGDLLEQLPAEDILKMSAGTG